jgi:hypothetical protein
MTAIDASGDIPMAHGAEDSGERGFIFRHWRGLGAGALALALASGGAFAGISYENRRNSSEMAQTDREKAVALALTGAGFPNVVSVEEKDGRMIAGLTDEGCEKPLSFYVEGPNKDNEVRVVMPQEDVEGNRYGTASAMDGEQATLVLQDLCS